MTKKYLLELVNDIQLSKNNALLGIHPLLAVYFGSDDTSTILESLKTISADDAKKLGSLLYECVSDPAYRHKDTCWTFNDPHVDVSFVKTVISQPKDRNEALQKINAVQDLVSFLELHKNTYPFIETFYEPLLEDDVLKVKNLDGIKVEYEVIPNIYRENPKLGISTIIVPTVALGSLYMLSKIPIED